MNLNKAIESNHDLLDQPWLHPFPEYIESITLGIEALKMITSIRNQEQVHVGRLLPGETEN